MRSPLTETIHRVQGMITYVRDNLSTDEYNLFLDLLVPEPEPIVKVAKKARKKRATKSAHQQSLSSAIQRAGKGKVDAESDSDNQQPCIAYADDNGGLDLCGKFADDNVHHLQTHPDYHEFMTSEKAQTASGD